MADTSPITFDFDNDNRPIRESEIEGKLFEPQYRQSLLQIETYLRELELEKTEESQKESKDKSYTEHIQADIDYNNNIFAFEGGRGTGKTSCMISVAGMLQDKTGFDTKCYPKIEKDKFITIDLIDPAYFDKSHNLLSLFLAKLYKSFLQELEKAGSRISTSDKQDFLSYYREAHAQLHRLYHEKKNANFSDEDLMEYVEEVSASVNLKRTIKDLVDAYIDCFHWKDTILILRIDDVDMDFEHASEMIESMRKYFVQPNLLVFVSCSLEQLKKIKTQDFVKKVTDKKDDLPTIAWCQELADRYLGKVFPQSHCIKMPEPATYHDYELVVTGKFVTEAGKEVKPENDGDVRDKELCSRKFVSVKQALLELILKKTRYLFYNTSYYESYIVPRNLRELRQLMKLLITMPDYNTGNEPNRHNKTLFKEYFYGAWVQSNLADEDRRLVQKMQSVHDMTLFNKTLKQILIERFAVADDLMGYEKAPVSTSNILAIISAVEPQLIQERDRKLLFFIKSYYSILLYDTYCEVLSELDENGMRPLERKLKGEDGKTDSPIIRKDRWREYYDYEKLIGGSFIRLSKPNTEDTVLKSEGLSQYVTECIALCGKAALTPEESAKILMAELLILSIYCARVNSEDANISLYEQWKTLPAKEEKPELVISVGALLFNITRYDQSICRYSKVFYEAISSNANYMSFKRRITNAEEQKNDFGYIHRVALRNFEVLQDLLSDYKEIKSDSRLSQFFNDLAYVAGYSFPLYEYKDDNQENYNKIHLTFLRRIMEAVEPARNDQEAINKLFENTNPQTPETPDATGNPAPLVSDPAAQHAVESTETAK